MGTHLTIVILLLLTGKRHYQTIKPLVSATAPFRLSLVREHPKSTFQASLLSLLMKLSTTKGTGTRKLLMIPFLYVSVFVNTILSHFASDFQVSVLCSSFTVSCTEVTKEITLEAISKCLKDMTVIGNNEHEFMKGKSCLTNLIASCDEMTGLVDEARSVDVVYLNFQHCLP